MDDLERDRIDLVDNLIASEVWDERVLAVMKKVPRHLFVPAEYQRSAYENRPLPIGNGQTISQPSMVAIMTESLELTGDEKVLEIGTGSGYQCAILAELAKEVQTIERDEELAGRAKELLDGMGYRNVIYHTGDGSLGLEEDAPFDRIIVTAACPEIPEPLVEQLKIGGLMVIPVGGRDCQDLISATRMEDGLRVIPTIRCIFVPLIGKHAWPG